MMMTMVQSRLERETMTRLNESYLGRKATLWIVRLSIDMIMEPWYNSRVHVRPQSYVNGPAIVRHVQDWSFPHFW